MDALDKKLLTLAQTSFPLVIQPYAALGDKVGLTEAEVLARLARLQEAGIIRRLGAFFDSRRLGYYSTLCAVTVPEPQLDQVVAVVNSYAGVTHNYLREHHYNLWFTLIACSPAAVAQILAEIKKNGGLEQILELPALRVFKVRVVLDLAGGGDGKDTAAFTGAGMAQPAVCCCPGPAKKALVRALQSDLALEARPFERLGRELSCTGEEILEAVNELLAAGVIRRFGAALGHYRAGFTANAMVVWRVPEERVITVGETLAASPLITHCYQRQVRPEWPYNLFTMVHGPDRAFCRRVAAELAMAVGTTEYELIFSRAELKKSSMRYFLEEGE